MQKAEEKYIKTARLTPSDGIPFLSIGKMFAFPLLIKKAKNGSEKLIKKVGDFGGSCLREIHPIRNYHAYSIADFLHGLEPQIIISKPRSLYGHLPSRKTFVVLGYSIYCSMNQPVGPVLAGFIKSS